MTAAAVDDLPPVGGLHAGAEPEGLFAAEFAGLVGAFHGFSSD